MFNISFQFKLWTVINLLCKSRDVFLTHGDERYNCELLLLLSLSCNELVRLGGIWCAIMGSLLEHVSCHHYNNGPQLLCVRVGAQALDVINSVESGRGQC